MTQINDDKHCALLQLTGQTSGTNNDMVNTWLATRTGQAGTTNDLWHVYWNQQAIPAGAFNDRAYNWLQLTYAGQTLNDLWEQFWHDGCIVSPNEPILLITGWSHGDNCAGPATVTVLQFDTPLNWDLDADLIAEVTIADTTSPPEIPVILSITGKGSAKMIITHTGWNTDTVAGDSIIFDYTNISSNLRNIYGNAFANGTPSIVNCL